MEKVIRDGKVAVLYSPGWGAGWYTWNTDHPECVFDPEIVALVEADKRDEAATLAETKWNTEESYFYSGGAYGLSIAWIPIGTFFEIIEYDGNESVSLKERNDWLLA